MEQPTNSSQINILCKIRDTSRAISAFEQYFQQTHGLCLNEGMLLCTLCTTPRLTSNELSIVLGLSNSNTSKVIKSVESKKLIKRIVGSDDKRLMYFALTETGRRKMEEIKCAELKVPDGLRGMVG